MLRTETLVHTPVERWHGNITPLPLCRWPATRVFIPGDCSETCKCAANSRTRCDGERANPMRRIIRSRPSRDDLFLLFFFFVHQLFRPFVVVCCRRRWTMIALFATVLTSTASVIVVCVAPRLVFSVNLTALEHKTGEWLNSRIARALFFSKIFLRVYDRYVFVFPSRILLKKSIWFELLALIIRY